MRVYSPMNLRAMLSADNIAQELQKVQTYLRQLDGAINQIPGITGNPAVGPSPPSIVPNPFDNFFYLPGRPGGQIGYGDTNASGILVLSSTRNATKGNIYLGSARGSTFDELNSRLGLKTISPSATLHVKGEPPVYTHNVSTAQNFRDGWTNEAFATTNMHLSIDEAVDSANLSDYIRIVGSVSSSFGEVRFGLACTDPGVNTGHTVRVRFTFFNPDTIIPGNCKLSVALNQIVGLSTVLIKNVDFTATNGAPSSTQFTTSTTELSFTLTEAEAANITDYANLELSFIAVISAVVSNDEEYRIYAAELQLPSSSGGGGGGKTAIFQAVSTQTETLSEWQNSAGTALVDITTAGRLTVESGGSFRHVPGAAASTLFKGDASGDASWGTITLLSAYVSDTLAGTVARGDLIVGNSTPKWSKFAIGAASTLLTSNGTDPAWATVNLLSAFHADTLTGSVVSGDIIIGNATPKWARLAKGADGTVLTLVSGLPAWTAPSGGNHNLLSSTHSDTVASTPVRGGIIVANSTPAWAQLAVGSANTVIRSNGTDPSYGTIDHNYIDDRTRSIWITPSMMTTTTGTMSLGMVGSYPNNYHAWQFTTSAAAGNNKGVHMSFTVPLDWKTGTDMTIYIYTAKVAGGADAAGYDVITSYISRATAESLTTAVTANAFVGPLNSTTLHLLTITNAGTIANGTLSGGEYVKLNVVRDTDQEITDNGSSTNNTMGLVMVRIDYTAVM